MAEIKLTKNELRSQQTRLSQLQKYLPTLQLKKALLQSEVTEARHEIEKLEDAFSAAREAADKFIPLLTEMTSITPSEMVKIKDINRRYENIAGIEVPYLDNLSFEEIDYSLLETPPWLDALIQGMRKLTESFMRIEVAREKKAALEKELRQVSIRVNLFEKILIPRAERNIKKIKVFLGDQQLSAVAMMKVAKTKIEENNSRERHLERV